ncbi:MAG: DUF1501 domain-containing protein [Pirellulaceae bacterium]|nr:DUF1501 domain-containing protein [Pirellulaceae bacterium]
MRALDTNRNSQRYPCGMLRREALWQMGGGFAGVALTAMLEQDGFFHKVGYAAEPTTSSATGNPLAPRAPHFVTKAKSCIFLMMNGGPSQVDTWDFKPALQKYAGKSMPADKKFINSGGRAIGYLAPAVRPFRPGGESGLMISDFFPKTRQHADKLAVIRSCYTDTHAHGSALVQMNSGKPIIGRPSLGSWITYGLGSENQDLPGYVVMLDKRGGPIGGQPNWSSGFIPASFQGTLFRPVGNPILDLAPPSGVTRQQQRGQLDLLAELNRDHRATRPGASELAARAASYELAFRMQAEAPPAVDLGQESASTLQAYGVDLPQTAEFGRNCLIARRLVERGVRFIQLYSGGGHLEETWDAHQSVELNHGRHALETDQPIAALLTDLANRGLLDSTLVVWGGEFGRMPFSEGVGKPGRNHNPYGFSMWMAGSGVKGGVAYGETDELGFEATSDRVHVHDIHATILHLLGLDHTRLTYFHQGRDDRLTDVFGRVISEVIST